MKWAFVDYENVNSLNLLRLSDYEWVVLFCGPKDKNLKIDLSAIESGKSPRLEIIRLDKSAKNNLDFHLALYLGRYHETVEEAAEFSVVSNDTGFDGVIAYLKNLGRKCKRIKDKPAAAKKAAPVKKAAAKKTVAKKATAKKAVEKSAKKAAAKKVAVSKVEPTLNTQELMEALTQALQVFKKHPATGWPKTESKMLSWMEDQLKLTSEASAELMQSMLRKNHIASTGGKITYHLDFNKIKEV